MSFQKKLKADLECTKRFKEYGEYVIDKLNMPSGNFKCAAYGIFIMSHKNFHASYVLSCMGFGQQAFILSRPLLEAVLNLYWIELDPEERAKKFLYYYLPGIKKSIALASQNDPKSIDEKFKSEFSKIYKEAKPYIVSDYDWTGISVARMFKEVEEARGDHTLIPFYYDHVYYDTSGLIHATARGLESYVVTTDKGKAEFYYDHKPGVINVDRALTVARDAYLRILDSINDIFGLKEDSALEGLLKSHSDVIKNST